MENIGLDFASVKKINEKIIYAEISGYGKIGPWKNKPGQDLLLQSISGLAHTSGDDDHDPVPFGIAIADIMGGTHLVQGILAALIRRQKKGAGALIEVSLLESLLDFQFELLTTYFSSNQVPQRSKHNNGHTLLSAPYGIYATSNGFIAIAMVPLTKLATAIECGQLSKFNQHDAFRKRDEIKKVIGEHLSHQSASYWANRLHEHGLWGIEVLDWLQMKKEEAYKSLAIEQSIGINGKHFVTTRCPIRVDGRKFLSSRAAPSLGEQNETIKAELFNTSE
jgi:crotonobetainyl-CoA:carnitine CoA-transferase CaiB-like acyl-CoA transferase